MVESSRIGVEGQIRRHSTLGCSYSTFEALLALSWQKGSIAGLSPKGSTRATSFGRHDDDTGRAAIGLVGKGHEEVRVMPRCMHCTSVRPNAGYRRYEILGNYAHLSNHFADWRHSDIYSMVQTSRRNTAAYFLVAALPASYNE